MSIEELSRLVFRIEDRAELLGAVFGDGSIEQRGHKGYKVSVGVSDRWPRWHAAVPALFHGVFGRCFERRKKISPTGVTYYEYHVTTHDLVGMLGVTSKHDDDGRIVPPLWIEQDAECLRRFIRGLVETDGCFTRDRKDGTPTFLFSQNNDHLAAWFTQTLCKQGFACHMVWAEQADVNQPQISRTESVQQFGEWVRSEKWLALVEHGWEPKPIANRKTGAPIQPREARVLKTIPEVEQERWREWRRRGASILAIARHVGRANTVVYDVVCDIQPNTTSSAEDMGLNPQPRRPRGIDDATYERWREAARAGEPSRTIADREGVRQGVIDDATSDIRWDQLIAKRELHKEKLERMKTSPQGQGRWNGTVAGTDANAFRDD
jgi:hypothetical protein